MQSLGGIFYNFMASITFHDLVLHSSSKEYGNEQGKRNKEGLSTQSANKFLNFSRVVAKENGWYIWKFSREIPAYRVKRHNL